MTPSPLLRKNLADVRERISKLRDKKAAAKNEAARAKEIAIDAMTQAEAEGRSPRDVPQIAHSAQLANKINAINAELQAAQEEERFYLSQLAGADSIGTDTLFHNPELMQELASLAASGTPIGSRNLGLAMTRDELVAQIGSAAFGPSISAAAGELNYSDDGAMRRGAHRGVWEQPRRRLTLLDLFPSAPMEGSSFEYTRDVAENPYSGAGVVSGAGATLNEGVIKPAVTEEFEDDEAKAKTIANYVKAKRQQLADMPILEQLMRIRLAYRVMRALEFQVVQGDGTGQNLTGILHTDGIASIPYDSKELAADQALEGLVAVLLSEAIPSFVALNPYDWALMLKAKSDGSGEYFSGGPFVQTAQQLWGVAVVPSNGVTKGQALIGDPSLGATVFVREGVNVRMSDSDQDDFVKNRVTLLGEGRFALAVWDPKAFAVVEFEGEES